jgi:hypothetical protein
MSLAQIFVAFEQCAKSPLWVAGKVDIQYRYRSDHLAETMDACRRVQQTPSGFLVVKIFVDVDVGIARQGNHHQRHLGAHRPCQIIKEDRHPIKDPSVDHRTAPRSLRKFVCAGNRYIQTYISRSPVPGTHAPAPAPDHPTTSSVAKAEVAQRTADIPTRQWQSPRPHGCAGGRSRHFRLRASGKILHCETT